MLKTLLFYLFVDPKIYEPKIYQKKFKEAKDYSWESIVCFYFFFSVFSQQYRKDNEMSKKISNMWTIFTVLEKLFPRILLELEKFDLDGQYHKDSFTEFIVYSYIDGLDVLPYFNIVLKTTDDVLNRDEMNEILAEAQEELEHYEYSTQISSLEEKWKQIQTESSCTELIENKNCSTPYNFPNRSAQNPLLRFDGFYVSWYSIRDQLEDDEYFEHQIFQFFPNGVVAYIESGFWSVPDVLQISDEEFKAPQFQQYIDIKLKQYKDSKGEWWTQRDLEVFYRHDWVRNIRTPIDKEGFEYAKYSIENNQLEITFNTETNQYLSFEGDGHVVKDDKLFGIIKKDCLDLVDIDHPNGALYEFIAFEYN